MKQATVTGCLTAHRDGYGFVAADDGGGDIFIPARYLRDNLHGDVVRVRVQAQGAAGKREGRIVETVEPFRGNLVGRISARGAHVVFIPDEQRITAEIVVAPGEMHGAVGGDIVVAALTAHPAGGRPAQARILEVLGKPDDSGISFLRIARKYGLSSEFPPEVRAELRGLPTVIDRRELQGRRDLRQITTVTIDGETARDFDDAVAVRREMHDMIRLWVSIADVSHYVAPGSALDREAFTRGTSVYFPGYCIPMLPEELSNGTCSLNPREERLTVTVELLIDAEGIVRETDFYPSVIVSDARLTYTEVKEVLQAGEQAALAHCLPFLGDLRIMEQLALRLQGVRQRRGSIDFDLPEPEIILDLQGRPESIGIAERTLAHRIIEEFMLAANEAVASYLQFLNLPCLFRIHEPPEPDRLAEFQEFIKPMGLTLPAKKKTVQPADLQRLLADVSGRVEEKMVNEVLLRCMRQARYSAENLGHFGLASPCYLHFTSPIRRYPDLVVHRILKAALGGGEVAVLPGTGLDTIAEQANRRERSAVEAEREVIDLKRLEYMADHCGEVFDGFVTGVSAFGFFVKLADLLVEGLVHVSVLHDDYYRLVEKEHALVGERTGRRYRIGDPLRVRVDGVNAQLRRIDFSCAGGVQRRVKPMPAKGTKVLSGSRPGNSSGHKNSKNSPKRGRKRR